MEKAPYTVKSPLDHNGKRYEIDSTVKLTEEEFAALPEGRVVPAEAKEEKKGGKK